MPGQSMTRRLNRQYNDMKHSVLKILALGSCLITLAAPFAFAQTNGNEDITSSNFSLVVCDGPAYPKSAGGNPKVTTYDAKGNPSGTREYVVCDFYAAMHEVQHLINIMVILGVVASIAGFCYAGFLLIARGSEPGARSEASDVFMKVAKGFIIMLTAWFLVYQILAWLECGPGNTDCQAIGSSLLKATQ